MLVVMVSDIWVYGVIGFPNNLQFKPYKRLRYYGKADDQVIRVMISISFDFHNFNECSTAIWNNDKAMFRT